VFRRAPIAVRDSTIDDVLAAKQRQALLVMATGAGKTRTVIALVKQLMEAWWVKTVLFHHAFIFGLRSRVGNSARASTSQLADWPLLPKLPRIGEFVQLWPRLAQTSGSRTTAESDGNDF
jgi:Type III restriction enzyme, res subunit